MSYCQVTQINSTNIYLFKFKIRKTRRGCEIFFKIGNKETTSTSMFLFISICFISLFISFQCSFRCSFFIPDFEEIFHFLLVFLLITLNRQMFCGEMGQTFLAILGLRRPLAQFFQAMIIRNISNRTIVLIITIFSYLW